MGLLFDMRTGNATPCIYCGGSGKLRRMAKAKQLNGPDVTVDYDSVRCTFCNGTGLSGSNASAPRHRGTISE